jgi:signal transduction histidine kinase
MCSSYKQELDSVLRSRADADVSACYYPAHCCFPGGKKNNTFPCAGKNCSFIELFGSTCLDRVIIPDAWVEHCHVNPVGMCFYLFANRTLVDQQVEKGAYLVTPGWLAKWRSWIKRWKFEDQRLAVEYFRESCTTVLLLDTGVDAKNSQRNLREFAGFIDRPWSVMVVGLDYFAKNIENRVLAWQLEKNRRDAENALHELQMQKANYAMGLDMISSIVRTATDEELVNGIFEIFTMLFAPKKMLYVSLVTESMPLWSFGEDNQEDRQITLQRLLSLKVDYADTDSAQGFRVRICHGDNVLGILEVDEIAFPEYMVQYRTLILLITSVCALAITNALAFQDITRSKDALRITAAQLLKSETQLRSILNANPDGILIVDHQGDICYANPAVSLLFEKTVEELLNVNYHNLVKARDGELEIPRTAGDKALLEIRSTSVLWNGEAATLIALRDITARRRTEERLNTAQRLANLVTLSAGLAHELNSPLQVVTGVSDRLLKRLRQGQYDAGVFEHNLDMMNRNAWRVAEIVRSIELYTNAAVGDFKPVDLNSVILDSLGLDPRLEDRSKYKLELELAPALPLLNCDRNNMGQVLNNLISNAIDAMPDGGTLNIRTGYDEKASLLMIRLSNTGASIPEEIREKIFEPFFTTKPVGSGKGLGLAVVMGVVSSLEGRVKVDSEVGKGTVFTLFFPLTRQTDLFSDGGKNAGRYEG